MSALSEDQVATLLRQAGFPENKIPLMINIGKRESSLNPYAHNPNAATGDNSYGLFQINMIGDLGRSRLKEYADLGIKSYDDLKDPWKNVQAAKRVLDSQGLSAWTTYEAAARDPMPTIGKQGESGNWAAASDLPAAAREMDQQELIVRAGGNPVVTAILMNQPNTPQETRSVLQATAAPSAMSTGAAPGSESLLEYLTGDPDHGGYRADHGGGNYHEHLAFKTRELRDAAISRLRANGIQIGSINDGRHAPGSYHYQDLAFDVPAAQVPVGQEQELSRRVRNLLGIR